MASTTKILPTARHDIRLCGLTGLIFAILTTALILYLEGFVTASWSVESNTHQGLWQTCERKDASPTDQWFRVVQVFACLSLVAVVFSFLLITFYLTTRDCKNFNLLTLVLFCFLTATFMLVTVGVFGAYGLENKKTSWSYWVVVVAAILSVLAAFLSIAQIRRSNVRVCCGSPQE